MTMTRHDLDKKEEGGVQATISTVLALGCNDEVVLTQLQEQYNLIREDALQQYKLYLRELSK